MKKEKTFRAKKKRDLYKVFLKTKLIKPSTMGGFFNGEEPEMKRIKINEIDNRVHGKPYLFLVETSVNKIPEAIEEYDPAMFICFNVLRQEYEVHSLSNRGDTHAMSIPWDTLDQRVIELVWRRDQKKHSLKEIIRDIDRHNEEIEERRQRDRRNELNAIARDQRGVFKKFAEEFC